MELHVALIQRFPEVPVKDCDKLVKGLWVCLLLSSSLANNLYKVDSAFYV